METRCPHCSRVQTVYDGMANAQIRCEECRGSFTAEPLPKLEELPATDEMPRFTHFGPGWWLTCISIILALSAFFEILIGQFMVAISLVCSALTVMIPALIINYLGHISKLVEYGLIRDSSNPKSKIVTSPAPPPASSLIPRP